MGAQSMICLRRRGEHELLARIGERVVRDQRGDVAELGGFGLQKFAARGNAVEKIGDADRRACGKACGLYADEFAAGEFDAGAFGFFGVARFEQQPRDGRDGRHRFTAETERGDRHQIVGRAQFAGGVALEGQQRVVVRHAVPIVDDANHALAAGFDFDANGLRTGVERVLEQLFDDGRRALDDFARGDAVGDSFRKYADAAHEGSSL